MKFSIFTTEKNSLYISWASFHNDNHRGYLLETAFQPNPPKKGKKLFGSIHVLKLNVAYFTVCVHFYSIDTVASTRALMFSTHALK